MVSFIFPFSFFGTPIHGLFDVSNGFPEAILEPVRKALETFEKHLGATCERWTSTHNNARVEGLNSLFQATRARARGYRNTATFITVISVIAAPIGNLLYSI